MSKILISESELRSLIAESVKEEISSAINEGLLGNVILGAVAPGVLANKLVTGFANTLDPWNKSKGSTSSSSNSKSRRERRKEKKKAKKR
jgi:hypothetical protein